MAIAKLAVIGAGQIGIRHLQALMLINRNVLIQVVDPSNKALDQAKNLISNRTYNGNKIEVDFLQDIESLAPELDLVIVAITANVRSSVVKSLLNQKKVKYLILEKILFQKLEDFSEINDLLEKNKVKTWVNCPLRMNPFYKSLKETLNGTNKLDYHISYSDLGIASNTIHHLDIIAYLTGQTEFTIDASYLDDQIIPSKRSGFIEFTGTLIGTSKAGSRLIVTSYKDNNIPPIVQINSNKVRCLIKLKDKKALISKDENNWLWEEVVYTEPYQSQLTHFAVQQILDTGNSDLTPYTTSWKLHVPLLKTLMEFIKKNNYKEVISCPIT